MRLIHEIHDLSNDYVVELLRSGLSKVTNENILVNYHPMYQQNPANLFYILTNGKYRKGHGKYFVIEEDGVFVASAGWNQYDSEPTTALVLTRMYIDPAYRAQYIIGNSILPQILTDTEDYAKIWITVNEHNKVIYKWFERASENKRTTLFNDWPPIYRNFRPIGQKTVNYTEQYVVEFKREKTMTDLEKIEFIENAISMLFKKSNKHVITPESNLLDIGLDSLDIVELQMYYEEQTNNLISSDSRISTVKDLMELMK
jgi:acyl carrier protein